MQSKWLYDIQVNHVRIYDFFLCFLRRWASSFSGFLRFTCWCLYFGLWRLCNGVAEFWCFADFVIWRRNLRLRSRRLSIDGLLVIQSCLTSSFGHNEMRYNMSKWMLIYFFEESMIKSINFNQVFLEQHFFFINDNKLTFSHFFSTR